jgi:hypothetical protein
MTTPLRQALERVARRFRQARLWSGLGLCWLIWAIIGFGLWMWGSSWIATAGRLASFVTLAMATGLVWAVGAVRSARDPRWVARRIEAKHPELAAGLLAAVEQDASPSGQFGYLQAAVIREALHHRKTHDWDQTISTRRLRSTHLAHLAALGLLIVVSTGLVGEVRSRASNRAARALSGRGDVQIDPGNTEIERGSSLLVVARFLGAVPADASLVFEDGTQASRLDMTRSLEDPAFAGRIAAVDADLTYHVECDGLSTENYHIHVFEYPELLRADARLVFPEYTALEPKTVEDIRHVTAVEGSELTLLCRLNKEVAAAQLVDEEGQSLTLAPLEKETHVYTTTFKLAAPRRYRVQLVDREGRRDKLASEIAVNVTRNRPPVITVTQPSHDTRVSPLEELRLQAKIEDDFGLLRQGLTYSMAGQEPREVLLPSAESKGRSINIEHLLDFEALQSVPDQLLTYFFWAEDFGPDGKSRRTLGDMFFAEVRPFEEIFRQGEQPPGGSVANEEQAGNAQEADRLAELQKQIINGTWKVLRREIGAKPTDPFIEDAKTLQESQHSVIEQANQLGGRLRDRQSKANLAQATTFMKDAEKQLTEAVRASSIAALHPALVAEQSAYQALLKLRAGEYQVIRGNARQRAQGGGGGSPSSMQLQQLELSADENRYEEQRSARSQQETAQRVPRQILNRLRELAQRQTDLNERIKELQSALAAAKTEEARQQIERQLKRLREQQREILRDTDELRERMEREENRDRLADARQQLEQGREHVRQASVALEEGRLSQALTAGSRAGRQLNDLREQLRKNAANRFAEDMTEMRAQARRLEEKQNQLTEQLESWNRQLPHSLRDSGPRAQVQHGLAEQRKQLDQLLDRLRSTVQEAEDTEPLLAKGLYDAAREAAQNKLPDALKGAEQLVDVGVPDEAAKLSRHAGQGLRQLRQGVERAVESVLGDETATLRRAQGELDDLADQIHREIARATGHASDEPNEDLSRPSARQAQDGQNDRNRRRSQDQGPSQKSQQNGQQGQRGQEDPQGQRGSQSQGGLRGGNAPRGNPQGQRSNAPGGAQPNGQEGAPRGGGPEALDRMLEGLAQRPEGPITGEGFRQWTDRMREVEELLDDPELRAEAARIRDRVRGAREDYKRRAKEPDWTQLQNLVAQPFDELRDRIAEEVRRREKPDSLVPIDRDPVPPHFAEGVRRYYERLGSGR